MTAEPKRLVLEQPCYAQVRTEDGTRADGWYQGNCLVEGVGTMLLITDDREEAASGSLVFVRPALVSTMRVTRDLRPAPPF